MFPFLESRAAGLIAAIFVALLIGARVVIREKTHQGELKSAIIFFAGFLAAWFAGGIFGSNRFEDAERYTRVASYLLFWFGCLRVVITASVWALRTRRGLFTPKILRDVVDVLLYMAAVGIVLKSALQLDLGGLIATSAVLSVVIGLALQETLGNLFAGLSLQFEPPFAVGDWIQVGPHLGKVLQVTWRQTKIETDRKEHVIVPNSVIGKEYVINFSRTQEGLGREFLIELDYDSPPNAVKQACMDVLLSHPSVRKHPLPKFRVRAWEQSGIQYQVRYFTDDFPRIVDIGDELLTALWYRVRREGFSIPFPTRTVHLKQDDSAAQREQEKRGLPALLASVDFLRPLGPDGLVKLASLAKLKLYGRDETIIHQGETGDTFYLIVSGEASVHTAESKDEVARLRRGDFFGEMSLLTGEPRAATVTAVQDSVLLCVDRPAFAEILRSDDLAKALSEALAARTEGLKAKAAGGGVAAANPLESKRILARLRDLFRLR